VKVASAPAFSRSAHSWPHRQEKPVAAVRRVLRNLLRRQRLTFPAVALAEAGDIEGAVELLGQQGKAGR
jgi:hypothetical protein